MLTYDGSQIHPEYVTGHRPRSRKSTIHWVDFHRPPRKHIALWKGCINLYVRPRVPVLYTSWDTRTKPHYNTTFYKSTRTGKLYEKVLHERYNIHDAIRNQPGSRTTTFHITNSEAELSNVILQSLEPIDVAQSKHHITILCSSGINQHGCHTIPAVQNKYSFYRKLPK